MKMVLFDLGKTLADEDALLPGALETLAGIAALRRGDGPAALLGSLGMRAVHFRGPGQTSGELERLTDLIPLARDFVGGSEESPDRIVIFREPLSR